MGPKGRSSGGEGELGGEEKGREGVRAGGREEGKQPEGGSLKEGRT